MYIYDNFMSNTQTGITATTEVSNFTYCILLQYTTSDDINGNSTISNNFLHILFLDWQKVDNWLKPIQVFLSEFSIANE